MNVWDLGGTSFTGVDLAYTTLLPLKKKIQKKGKGKGKGKICYLPDMHEIFASVFGCVNVIFK